MNKLATLEAESQAGQSDSPFIYLKQAIDQAAHFLPAQGPITVFIHHNTLHAFEHLPFDEAVQQGGRLFGCQPYLSEERYLQERARGRITRDDLEAVLRLDLGESADEPILHFGTRLNLRQTMLEHPIRLAPAAELRWFVAETDALTRFPEDVAIENRHKFVETTRQWVMRDLRGGENGGPRIQNALADLFQHYGQASIERWSDTTWEAFALQALWRVCRDGVHGLKPPPQPAAPAIRLRDLLLEATGDDSDLLVDDVLIRFCAAFLDQGFSHWPLPEREKGFLAAFTAFYGDDRATPELWLRGLPQELERFRSGELEPLESIAESLDTLDISEANHESFLTATLLALRGWAGMIDQVERRADAVVHPIPEGSLVEYLAVRLILERLALAHVARESLGYTGELSGLRAALRAHLKKHEAPTVEQRAFTLFQVARVLGWTPGELFHLSKADWVELVSEIESFPAIERRRLFHAAYERHYHVQALDAYLLRARLGAKEVERPKFQVICCLDEREESFRRHMEELEPQIETFGAAGFYSVAMYYRGAADAHFVPLCPIIVRPEHWVTEEVVYTLDPLHRRRAKTRRALGLASHQFHVSSRTVAGGALLAAGLGALATIPLVARVLFPRLTAQVRKLAGRLVQPPPITQLQLQRSGPEKGPQEGKLGYTIEEMAAVGERLLRDMGLTTKFARIVVFIGHGSSSLNNPHTSAYNCGACGGGMGGPNARAMAQMLNDSRVRRLLGERGLTIPTDTVFIGAYHNTCNDAVTYYDLDRLPKSYQRDFDATQQVIDEACDRNAHERCRRFMSAPLNLSITAARRHVESRSEDLAQTRPECGHATNAVCVVGRRSRSRGLFADRRTFFTSYDPTQDDEQNTILTRVLQAAVPVCAGINLEYYFSYVDSPGYGCGTKLPHNVSALLGIMDGAASDLRTGLPWQMVEIHEPIRLLFLIETTPEAMNRIMDANPGIARVCRNGWVTLATLDPDEPTIHVLRGNQFELYEPQANELPKVGTSNEWYRGLRDHLGFALIDS